MYFNALICVSVLKLQIINVYVVSVIFLDGFSVDFFLIYCLDGIVMIAKFVIISFVLNL